MGVFSGLDLGTSRFYDGVALADAAEREKMALEELRRNRELQKRKSQIGTPDYNYNPELGAVNPGSLAAVGDPEDYSAIDTEPTTRDFREPGLTLRDTDKRPVTNEEFGTAVFGPEFTSPEEQLKKGESLKNVIPFWESGPAISRDPVYTYDDSGRRRPDTGLRKLLSEVDSKNYSWGAGQIGAVQYTILKREGVSAYDYAARQFYRSPEAFKILSENPRLISEFKENPTELYKKLRKAGVLKKEDSKHMRTNIARGNKEGFMPDAVEFFGDISALETKAGETKKSKDYAAKRVESVTKSIATDRLENKVSVYTVKQAELLGINRYHALTLLAMESDFGTTGEGKNNPLGITAKTYNDMIAGKAGYAALSENIKKAGVADSYAKSSKEDRILMGLLRFKYSKDIGVDNDKLGAAYNGSAEKANENLYDKQNKLYSQDYNDAFNQVYGAIQAAHKPTNIYTPEAGLEFGGSSIEQKAVTYLSNAGTEAEAQGGYTNTKTRQEHIVEQNLNYLNQHREIAAEYGAGDEVMKIDVLIAGEHAKLWHQQGLRGLQNLFTAGDFSKLQQVLQTTTGNNWELQVTADGKYTAFNNGRPHKLITGVTAEKAHHEFKKIIDANYYKQTVETSMTRSAERFTANLEVLKTTIAEQIKVKGKLAESASDISKRIKIDDNNQVVYYQDPKTNQMHTFSLGSYKDAEGKTQPMVDVTAIDMPNVGAQTNKTGGLDTNAQSYLESSKPKE